MNRALSLRPASALLAVLATLVGCHTSPSTRSSDTGPRGGGAHDGVPRDLQARMNEVILQWTSAFGQAKIDEQHALEERLRTLAVENFDALVEDLRGQDVEARFIAAMMLGFSRDAQAVPLLVEALQDPVDKVRNNAALGVGVIGSKQTPVAPVVLLLDDSNPNVRASAAFALQRVLLRNDDRGTMARLLRAMEDPVWEVRNNAVRALATVGKPEAVDPLVKRTLHDKSYLVRLNTAVALASIRDYRAIEPLIDALQESDPRVRKEIVFALQQITGQSFENDALQWRNWWRANEATLLPPAAPKAPAGTTGGAAGGAEAVRPPAATPKN